MQDEPISRKPPGWKPCSKESERCQYWSWGKDYLRPECCTDHLKELLFFVEELLIRHGIFHWLDLGTLLGAVRDQELIPWDTDIDFGVLKRDEAKIDALEEEINQAGYFFFKVRPLYRWRIYYSRTNLLGVDMAPWGPRDGLLRRQIPYKRLPSWCFPPHYLEKLEPVILYGKEFPAPSPVHEFLAQHRYGSGYLTPQRKIRDQESVPDVDVRELIPITERLLNEILEWDYLIQRLEKHSHQFNNPGERKTLSEKIRVVRKSWYHSDLRLARIVQAIYNCWHWSSRRVRWGMIGHLASLDHWLNLGTMKPKGVTLQQLPEIGSDEFSPLVGQLLYALRVREDRIQRLQNRPPLTPLEEEPTETWRESDVDQDADK